MWAKKVWYHFKNSSVLACKDKIDLQSESFLILQSLGYSLNYDRNISRKIWKGFGTIKCGKKRKTVQLRSMDYKELLTFLLTLRNTRVYNLISVTYITSLLLRDALISSKTEPRNGSKKEKRRYDKVRNNKTMLKILSFIRIHCLKQESNILPCFCSLEFEKG